MAVSSSSVSRLSLLRCSFFLTKLRQMTGEPNLSRQEVKWSAAGDAKGVARSTGERRGEEDTIGKSISRGAFWFKFQLHSSFQ